MKNETEKSAVAYEKAQILKVQRFERDADALNFLLEADKTYTLEETERILNQWKKGQVK